MTTEIPSLRTSTPLIDTPRTRLHSPTEYIPASAIVSQTRRTDPLARSASHPCLAASLPAYLPVLQPAACKPNSAREMRSSVPRLKSPERGKTPMQETRLGVRREERVVRLGQAIANGPVLCIVHTLTRHHSATARVNRFHVSWRKQD